MNLNKTLSLQFSIRNNVSLLNIHLNEEKQNGTRK